MTKKNLIIIIALIIGLFAVTPPLQQDELYHNFADKRHVILCTNTWDVLSNLPFILFGIWGLIISLISHHSKDLKTYLITFFIGSILVGLGSGYYHLKPNSETLVWDRLPMTISFMSLVCLIMHITDLANLAKKLFLPLLICGISSVIYWAIYNDLKPYILVQFVPMIWIPIHIIKSKTSYAPYLWKLIIFYTFAKALEMGDRIIYEATQHLVSGHSLKHISASLSILIVVLLTKKISTPMTGSSD
ncbi:MAG: ceramidase [Lentisphaeraceae bacterium]|nr:ceramidase [Lentisphaeraceae bacterium]